MYPLIPLGTALAVWAIASLIPSSAAAQEIASPRVSETPLDNPINEDTPPLNRAAGVAFREN